MIPKLITICGSSRFVDVMAVCGWILERDEHAIVMSLHLLPGWYTKVRNHTGEEQGVATEMDRLHFQKIDLSDEVFVVDVDGYIGQSTTREIAHARLQGKPVRYFSCWVDTIPELADYIFAVRAGTT